MSLSQALQKILATPDDLTELPKIIEEALKYEKSEVELIDRVGRLQELNKSYLGQIPIDGMEPPKEKEKETEVTIEDATNYFVSYFKEEK